MTNLRASGAMTTQEVAARFNILAIPEELFSDSVKSIDPENSPYI